MRLRRWYNDGICPSLQLGVATFGPGLAVIVLRLPVVRKRVGCASAGFNTFRSGDALVPSISAGLCALLFGSFR